MQAISFRTNWPYVQKSDLPSWFSVLAPVMKPNRSAGSFNEQMASLASAYYWSAVLYRPASAISAKTQPTSIPIFILRQRGIASHEDGAYRVWKPDAVGLFSDAR